MNLRSVGAELGLALGLAPGLGVELVGAGTMDVVVTVEVAVEVTVLV
jgi:hypothetical protein